VTAHISQRRLSLKKFLEATNTHATKAPYLFSSSIHLQNKLYPRPEEQKNQRKKKEKREKPPHGQQNMCFQDLSLAVCATCTRIIGEVDTGTEQCDLLCGRYLSRHTGQRVDAECGVCEAKREDSARRANALRKFSLRG
jgi:hypothetical protein